MVNMVENPVQAVKDAIEQYKNTPTFVRSGRGAGQQPPETLSVAQLAEILGTSVVTVHRRRRQLEDRLEQRVGEDKKGAVYLSWRDCLLLAEDFAVRPGQLKRLAEKFGTNPGTMRSWVRGLGIEDFTPENMERLEAHAKIAGYPGEGRKAVGLHSIQAQPGEYNTRQVGEMLDGLSRERIRQLVIEMEAAGTPVGNQKDNNFWYFTNEDVEKMREWRRTHKVGRRPKAT